MRATLLRSAFLASLSLLAAGCATLPDDERIGRELRALDHENRYRIARQECRARGGRMVIQAHGRIDRNGVPPRGSMYFCT